VKYFAILWLVLSPMVLPVQTSYEGVASQNETTQGSENSELLNLILTIQFIESNHDSTRINHKEDAVGIMQVRPIMILDLNRINGFEKYKLADRYSVSKSVEMFMDYQNHYNPEMDFEVAARIWNGGPNGHKKSVTIKYWNKVQKRI